MAAALATEVEEVEAAYPDDRPPTSHTIPSALMSAEDALVTAAHPPGRLAAIVFGKRQKANKGGGAAAAGGGAAALSLEEVDRLCDEDAAQVRCLPPLPISPDLGVTSA